MTVRAAWTIGLGLGLGLSLWVSGATATAASPACEQAEAIVEQVEAEYAAGDPDHAGILRRLTTARDLCPSLGAAWKYSYCSSSALGDSREAEIFKRRATFNGVRDLSCSIGGAAAVQPARAPLGPVREKFALLVGVSDFEDPRIRDLQFAAKDARDLAAALVDPCLGRFSEDNVWLLTDEQATRERILEALNAIILQAQEDDLVLLFFSTHGSPAREGQGLGGIGYLVTHDTEQEQPWLNGIEFANLTRKVALIKARRLITFLDSCYSGQARRAGGKDLLFETGGINSRDAELLLSGEGSYVISSSAEKQPSWESDRLQNGYFTHFLIDALRQQGGTPTLAEVFDNLSREVSAAVAREKQHRQEPQIFPEDPDADLRIGVLPSAAGNAVPACTSDPGARVARGRDVD